MAVLRVPMPKLGIIVTIPKDYSLRLRLAAWVVGFASWVAPKSVTIKVETAADADQS